MFSAKGHRRNAYLWCNRKSFKPLSGICKPKKKQSAVLSVQFLEWTLITLAGLHSGNLLHSHSPTVIHRLQLPSLCQCTCKSVNIKWYKLCGRPPHNAPALCKLTFDLLTLKVVSESRVTWPTSVPILVFLGLSVLDLVPMYATDRRQTRIIA